MEFCKPEQLEEYKSNGYLKIDNFFSIEDIKKIRKAYKECIDKSLEGVKIIHEDDGETVRSVMSYHNRNPILQSFTQDPQVLNFVRSITGSPFYVSQSKINPKAAVKDGVTRGKKWDYHRGFTFWNLLDGIEKPSMVSVFIYLTEQNKKNGAIYVLKGSHQDVSIEQIRSEISLKQEESKNRGEDTAEYLSLQIITEIMSEYKRKYEKVLLEGQAGDLVIMDPQLLHASDDNESLESRDLMITVYNPINNLPQHPREESYLCEPYDGELLAA